MAREFDSPWKDAIDEFLDSAVAFFHPELFAAIDWSVPYENLDAELFAIVREAELGKTDADRLFRVRLKAGGSLCLLIHAEVQSQHDGDLPQRMFVYHYRLKDRYNEPLVGLAILGDESQSWRPNEYHYDTFGTSVAFRFRSVKLLDWRGRYEELLTGENPLGVVIAAHLRSLDTNGQPEERSRAKWQLFRSLFDHGWTAERIRKLYRLIDWFLELPPELESLHKADALAFEQEQKMPYVTSIERLAKEEGRQEGRHQEMLRGIALALRIKFGTEGQRFAEELASRQMTLDKLEGLMESIETTATLTELRVD